MNDKLKEIRKLHDEYEAILAEMRIKYADKNHKPIELLTNITHLHRGELLDMVESQAKASTKNLLVFAATCAKAQQGLYDDEEYPFTKAELRAKLSFAASFIATMSMDLRHAAVKDKP